MKKLLLIRLFLLFTLYATQASEVSMTVNGCKISGTLEIPKSDKPVDVVLIIAGSGPTDRDGNNLITGKNNSLKMLADLFYKNGIASLRYDKRGIGASDKVNESNLSFDMYVNDAIEWVKYLRKDKRFSKIIIVGHSEGSLVGMIVAQRIDVDKFISLCGAGKPAYELIEEQLRNNKVLQELLNNGKVIMDSLKQGFPVKNVNPSLAMLFRPSVQPYIMTWFKYDPAKEISKLTIPILVVGGTTDFQVGVKDAELLSDANQRSKLVIVENMNHILKEVSTSDRMINAQTYSNPELDLSPEFCRTIIEFLNK